MHSTQNGSALGPLDDWGVLAKIDKDRDSAKTNPFTEGDPAELIPEAELPFLRTKVIADEDEEDEGGTVRTSKHCRNSTVCPFRLFSAFQ